MDNSLTQVDETTRQDLLQTVEDARALDQVFNTFDPALFLAIIVTGSVIIGLAWFVIGKLTATIKASGPTTSKKVKQKVDPTAVEQKAAILDQHTTLGEQSPAKAEPQVDQAKNTAKAKKSLDIGRRTRN